ncbi:hypothetical protein C2G38_2213063 [Gigaspora rosea]|uniref:RNI-like protein n=1 Tax=Gigaspora rosea TaxID=44941 RepID=A0A397UGJ4_9GLOM|nr:hypothetical protein C2G38_2213063 [Gigaspora rosea]
MKINIKKQTKKKIKQKLKLKNVKLTSLDLRDNQHGPEGGKVIADALCENSALTYLDLRTPSPYIKQLQNIND